MPGENHKLESLQYLQDSVFKEINILFLIAVQGAGNADVRFKCKERDISEPNLVSLFDIHSVVLLSNDRVTEITGKVKVDKPVGRDKLIHVVV